MKTAKLMNSDGDVIRQWQTLRPTLALTANRNCPAGWQVVIV